MQPIESTVLQGGAAPADRRCRFTKSDGFPCRDWAIRGHQHCFRHHQYLHSRPENPIEVPLLEDEDSLASLLSQTLRSLAWGTIPAANGRAILSGCRIMQGILTHRLATAKFHAKLRRLAVTHPEMTEAEDELFDREPPIEAELQPELHAEPATVPAPRTPDRLPASKPGPNAGSNPASAPSPRFPDLRKEWDQGLRRGEEELMKLRLPDHDKAPHPFAIVRGVPFTVPTPEQFAELVAAQGSLAR